MIVELNLLVALLKMTKGRPVLAENIRKENRIPSGIFENLLTRLQSEGMICMNDNCVQADANMRMQIAIKALSLGADFESIARLLQWQEFEHIAGVVLEHNGYVVLRNVRFYDGRRRKEIDVVGCREPIVICVDCKHWQRSLMLSSLTRIVEAQAERTKALANILPNASVKLECQKWKKAKFVPAVLSLLPGKLKSCNNVPVVPVLQLQDFVCHLSVHITTLDYIERTFDHLNHEFQD